MKAMKTQLFVAVVVILSLFLINSNPVLAVQGNIINIPYSAFAPGPNTGSSYLQAVYFGYIQYTGATYGWFISSINLPKGCTKIDKLSLFVANPGTQGIEVHFYRMSMSKGIPEQIGYIVNHTTSIGIVKIDIPLDLTKNTVTSEYFYTLVVALKPDVELYGAKVKYTSAP